MIIGNVVDSNLGDGITSGGMGHAAGKYALNNIFASNFITNNVGHNGGQVDVAHGKVRINPFCGGGGGGSVSLRLAVCVRHAFRCCPEELMRAYPFTTLATIQVIGDVWVDNTFQGAGADWAQVPTGPLANKNVSIFIP
jgi:hypothetical protein